MANKNMIRRLIFAATIVLCAVFLSPASVKAAEPSKAELYRQQTISEFDAWRKDIPDYEKRLYDRVKKVNSRSVRLYNLFLGGFVTILILNLGIFYIVLSGRRFRWRSPGVIKAGVGSFGKFILTGLDTLKNIALPIPGALKFFLFAGFKKSIHLAPNVFVLVSFTVAAAAFGSWIYFNRSCQNCQSLGNIYLEVQQKIFPPPAKQVIYNGKWVDTVKGELEYAPATDVHGDSKDETQLPIVEFTISQKTERKLVDVLPPWSGVAESLPEIKWPYFPAQFRYKERAFPVNIKYRGWAWDHYRLPHKKSWRVRFPKQQLFNGLRSINIINQRPLTTMHDVFQYEILRKHGFFLAQQKLVHFRKNGKYVGVQTFLEQPSNHFLTRNNMPVGQVYGEIHTMSSWEAFTDLSNWQIYSGDKENFEPLVRLFAAIKTKGTGEFKKNIGKILDVDHYLSYLANAAITLKLNPSSHNNRIYFDPKKGKFQIFPWYQKTEMYSAGKMHIPGYLEKSRGFYWVLNDIAHGLFLVPEYLEAFQQRVWKLINSIYHPRVLTDLYDQVIAATRADILADAHQHVLGLRRYFTNKEWHPMVARMRKALPVVDNDIRTQLANSALQWKWLSATGGDVAGLKKFGIVRFRTESIVSPKLRSVCFSFKQPVPKSTRAAFHLSTENKHLSAGWFDDGKRACFQLNDTIRAKLAVKNEVDRSAGGTLISGYKFAKVVRMVSEPKEYEYELAAKLPSDLEDGYFPEVDKVEVTAINGVTGAPIDKPADEVVAESLAKPLAAEHYYKFSPAIDDHSRFEPSAGLKNWSLPTDERPVLRDRVWQKGQTIHITEDTVLDEEIRLVIEPGVDVLISPGKSLVIEGALVAIGTPDNPIRFRSASADQPFGVIAITNTKDRKNHLRHVKISNGGNAKILDVSYLGALSIYAADALLENVTFEGNRTGDALNAVYSRTRLLNSDFRNNADCVDYDFSGGEIRNNTFENCGDDGIDLSHSDTVITGNVIRNSGDKGISIGEKSNPLVSNNVIENADMGIAVKDLSTPKLVRNKFINNEIGIALYIKKPEFGPPKAELVNNQFEGNKKNISVDDGVLAHDLTN